MHKLNVKDDLYNTTVYETNLVQLLTHHSWDLYIQHAEDDLLTHFHIVKLQ